jgi:hypothetical protein
MKKWIAAILASVLLAASGLVHGLWTDRWGTPPDIRGAAETLANLPLNIGPWRGNDVERSPTGAGVAGCLQRRYEHRQSGAVVSVAIVCGRPGPVSIHTPEACYGASGFQVGARQHVEVPGHGQFWRSDATRTTTTDETRYRIFYGWHCSHGWTAPDDPRIAFPREHILHKLYVVRDLSGPVEVRGEPCEDFLRAALPEMARTILSPDGTTVSGRPGS